MKKIFLPLFIFLFFILSSVSVFAYYPVELNVSITHSGSNAQFRCVNNTAGTGINCYHYSNLNFQRYNQTLQKNGECSLTANYSSGCAMMQMAVLNDSYVLFGCGNAWADLWDVSNIASNNCTLTTRTDSTGYNSSQYWTDASVGNAVGTVGSYMFVARKRNIIDKHNFLNVTYADGQAYWQSTYDAGLGTYWLRSVSIPYRNSIDNIYVSSFYGHDVDESPKILHYSSNSLNAIIDSINDLYGIYGNYITGGTGNTTYYDLITNNTGSVLVFGYLRASSSGTLDRMFKADFSNITVGTSDCNYAGEHFGTTCEGGFIYNTNLDNCHVLTGSCPSGTYCSQLTPQMNVSNDLVENYTDCRYWTQYGTVQNCLNLCYNNIVTWSNCIDDGCKVCPDSNGLIYWNGIPGYFTNTYYSNQATVSVPSYTVCCMNMTTGSCQKVVDNFGNDTTIIEILTRAGNTVTEYNQTLSTPTPASSVTVLKASINTLMGTDAGSTILAAFFSVVISMAIFFKTSSKKIETFAVPLFVLLGLFSLPGIEFFPTWSFLVMIAMTGVMIFFKAKG